MSAATTSTGSTAPGFEKVRDRLDAYLLEDPFFSAQLYASVEGEPVVDLVGGPDGRADGVTGVFSASKGVAGIVLGTLLRSGSLSLDETVAHYWPEFAAKGKGDILVRDALSHRAGLLGPQENIPTSAILDSRTAAEMVAAAGPAWRPGTSLGYHALTMGTLMEELVRRVTGTTLQRLYEELVREPRGIDFWLGLPRELDDRYVPLRALRLSAQQEAEMASRPLGPDGITALGFNAVNPRAQLPPEEGALSPNHRHVREAGWSAGGGVGSARGLAQVYEAALGYNGEPLLDERTIEAMSQQQAWGMDEILTVPMCFGVVFMKPLPRMEFGSYRAFGHDGAGGAIGFADPLHRLAFGYVPLPMQYPGGADPRAVVLSQIIRHCLSTRPDEEQP
ncbi:serine hydrolase domain-containing protein [Rathayibacter sp. Leaf296]|uniref:serine hydrolase domain-containing protein n=1 Tax=Rathayibacter sp. Leaf296 TaxID=1736327 RepID=UPI0007030EDC|nr:serine hydrolase domain-containing protein [Rathayibacter sp. Leaf296]KQQ08487.1 hypothetical protein ASF46_14405 [Rathayibacter sp. Leaf296]